MKKIKYANLLFLILSVIIFNSCIKPGSDRAVYLNRDFLSYFAFPKGSYWVYENKKNGESDSFYVETYRIKVEYDDKYKMNIENLKYNIFSKNEKLYGWAIPYADNIWFYEVNSHYRFVLPPEFDTKLDQCQCFLMKEHRDSVEVNGEFYGDVFITENLDSFRTTKSIKSEYYAKNVGVIKRIYFDSSQWELIKYHLAK